MFWRLQRPIDLNFCIFIFWKCLLCDWLLICIFLFVLFFWDWIFQCYLYDWLLIEIILFCLFCLSNVLMWLVACVYFIFSEFIWTFHLLYLFCCMFWWFIGLNIYIYIDWKNILYILLAVLLYIWYCAKIYSCAWCCCCVSLLQSYYNWYVWTNIYFYTLWNILFWYILCLFLCLFWWRWII